MKKTFKYILIFLATAIIITGVPVMAASSESDISNRLNNAIVLYIGNSKAYVNNVETKIDSENANIKPIIQNNRTLLPVRFVSESMGADVGWDNSTLTAVISLGERVVLLKPGSKKMMVNGMEEVLDVPAQIIDSRMYIPLRALVEALGKKVFYDRQLIIISGKEEIFNTVTEKHLIDSVIARYTGTNTVEKPVNIVLEEYDGGFFTIKKPKGWNIYTAGEGSTFAFLITDPSEPLRQIFYFTSVGPVYMSSEQKKLDYMYMQMGGYPISWYDMPVVDPLTPENFFMNFNTTPLVCITMLKS